MSGLDVRRVGLHERREPVGRDEDGIDPRALELGDLVGGGVVELGDGELPGGDVVEQPQKGRQRVLLLVPIDGEEKHLRIEVVERPLEIATPR